MVFIINPKGHAKMAGIMHQGYLSDFQLLTGQLKDAYLKIVQGNTRDWDRAV